MDGENKGHGHVFTRPDGVRMRCGGPTMCQECAHDAAVKAGLASEPKESESARFLALYNGYRQRMVDAILRDVDILGDRPPGNDVVNISRGELATILSKHL